MRRVHLILLISAAFVLGTFSVSAQEVTPDRVTVAWSDPSRPGLLKVNLLNGGISVKSHTGRDVIIAARPRSRLARSTPREAGGLRRIQIDTTGLNIEEDNNVMSLGTERINSAIDIDIQVPRRTNLNLRSVNGGNIAVEDVEGEIEVTNNNGDVTVTNVSGSVVAHSLNGRVVASLRQVTPQKPMAFTSLNGNIDVTLPPDLKANLKMRTDNGDIWSDFEVQLRRSASQSAVEDNRPRGGRYRIQIDKNMYGSINGGGPDIDLRTFNGNIYIRKVAR